MFTNEVIAEYDIKISVAYFCNIKYMFEEQFFYFKIQTNDPKNSICEFMVDIDTLRERNMYIDIGF